ncbi:hypothetical protein HMPREF1633_14405 [Tissierellia bacterium S5-A11]|nr:hypothetical protein HMPREF1633_14405 [Tissierellia bacterium S5-A11]
MVVKAEAEKTEENYRAAKTAVDALVKGSGKTGLEERLKAIRSYLDELKTSKEQAKEDIGNLPNLSGKDKTKFKGQVDSKTDKAGVDSVVTAAKAKDAENLAAKELKAVKEKAKTEIGQLQNLTNEEKAPFTQRVEAAQTKGQVDQAVADAKAKNDENGKTATEEEKDAAKEEIGNLPNLSEGEKKDAKDKVDNATTKGDVDKAVEDAKAKNEEKGKPATENDKNTAKDAIDQLPDLSEGEKNDAKGKVDNATNKGQVNQAVEDARAKDAENKNAADALDAKKQELIGKLDTKVNGKDVFDQDKKDALKDQINRAGNKEDLKAVEEEINKAIEAAGQVVPKPAPAPTPQAPGIRFFVLAPERQGQKPVEVKKTKQMTLEANIKIGSKKLTQIINGQSKEVEMDVAAYADKDRTYIPLRFVGEAMGFDVRWDNEARMAILKNKDKEVRVSLDSNIFYVNGEKFESDVKPQIKNDRTMIPVGNFARCLGLKDGKDIFWDQGSQQVTIKQVVNY